MRRNKQSNWSKFKALPGIVQFGVWLALAISLMLVWPTAARAQEMVIKAGAFTLRLQQGPCVVPELLQIMELVGAETTPKAMAVTKETSEGSEHRRGCWALDEDGNVLAADEKGGGARIPMSAFKPQPGV